MVGGESQKEFSPRVLLAKIGLDGHDRGVKVLARAFRDHGLEVIYTGLWQTCAGTMQAVLQEDVDVVGVSLLSAAHMTLLPQLVRLRRELDIEDIPIVLGGIIPAADHSRLLDLGVAAIFNPGSSVDTIVDRIRALTAERRRLAQTPPPADPDAMADPGAATDLRRLARGLTAIQRGEAWQAACPAPRPATLLGVTGAPGVGKSSFIARLAQQLRSHGQRVAVVAVDPSSPLTGGALLGDRIRMMRAAADADLFVRSLASRGLTGGLAPRCREIVEAISRFGFDYVIIETVGSGQIDAGVRELTEHLLLVLMPASGDAIQFSKSGIMELAACFVVNKSDLPGADATEGQLRGAVGDRRPVWRISTVRQEGFEDVIEWVLALRA